VVVRVFIGVDERQPIALTGAAMSIWHHCKARVSVEPINLSFLPITIRGLTQFTHARYMVPWMCGYEGVSIFIDGDVIVRGDICELAKLADPEAPVSVAQHVARFEWPSVMVFNNWRCKGLTPEYVQSGRGPTLEWSNPIGLLPPEWNHAVLYESHREDAKLVHFTAGIPCWPETNSSPHTDKWHEEMRWAHSSVSWENLMGGSVHRSKVEELNTSI
jgi:hypothetical protein